MDGFRALKNTYGLVGGLRGSQADRDNLMIAHQGFILSDGTVIGFFSDSMVRVDTEFSASAYSQTQHYDDEILYQAIGETYIGEYDFVHNNCQDWASRVDRNYRRLGGK